MTTTVFDSLGHVDQEALDLYVAGRLAEEDASDIRWHLRVCPDCRGEAERECSFRQAVLGQREVLERLPVVRQQWRFPEWFAPIFTPALRQRAVAVVVLFALALMLAPLIALFSPFSEASGQPFDAQLYAPRSDAFNVAPAGRILRLHLDMAVLPASGAPWRATVVNRQGELLANRPLAPVKGAATASFIVQKPLASGQYWVRLFGRDGQVREYSLRIR
jgi:hypothetical protein